MEAFKGPPVHGKQDQKSVEQEQSVRSSLNRIRSKFLVMRGNGGVGKTSVSVNLDI